MTDKPGQCPGRKPTKPVWIVAISGLLVIAYCGDIAAAFSAKTNGHRAVKTLLLLREKLSELGVEDADTAVGLEAGKYSGCRVWLMEHRFSDGCLGLRMSEDIRPQVGPENIKDILQQICRKDSKNTTTSPCEYAGTFAVSVRYFRAAREYVGVDGGITAALEQSGNQSHFRVAP